MTIPIFSQMRYVEYNPSDSACIHVVLSQKAYSMIISEVLRNGIRETGGLFIGRIYKKIWYVVDVVDEGLLTQSTPEFFSWDRDYVNHVYSRIREIYKYPLTILGFWHKHPGSIDYFSIEDEQTIQSNLQDAKNGLISMLVNLDPELRMTFYWCYGTRIMQVKYDFGDKYFVPEFLQLATPEEIIQRSRQPYIRIRPIHKNSPEPFSRSISERSDNDALPYHNSQADNKSAGLRSGSGQPATNNEPSGGVSSEDKQRVIDELSRGISDRLTPQFDRLARLIRELNPKKVRGSEAERLFSTQALDPGLPKERVMKDDGNEEA